MTDLRRAPSPIPADPAGVAALIQARLSEVAGEGVRPVSLSLDFGPACGLAPSGVLDPGSTAAPAAWPSCGPGWRRRMAG